MKYLLYTGLILILKKTWAGYIGDLFTYAALFLIYGAVDERQTIGKKILA